MDIFVLVAGLQILLTFTKIYDQYKVKRKGKYFMFIKKTYYKFLIPN